MSSRQTDREIDDPHEGGAVQQPQRRHLVLQLQGGRQGLILLNRGVAGGGRRREWGRIRKGRREGGVIHTLARTTLHSPRYYYAAQRCTAARRSTAHTLSIPPTTSSGASAPLVSTWTTTASSREGEG